MDAGALIRRRLEEVAPGFRRYVESEDNLFSTDGAHGVLAACSDFVREHPARDGWWKGLAAFANNAVGGGDQELDEAVCTCFLENLAGRNHPLDQLLRGEALVYWRRWCDGV